MSHNFQKGECTLCGNILQNMTRGDDGRLPPCPDAQPSGKYSQIYIYIYTSLFYIIS